MTQVIWDPMQVGSGAYLNGKLHMLSFSFEIYTVKFSRIIEDPILSGGERQR